MKKKSVSLLILILCLLLSACGQKAPTAEQRKPAAGQSSESFIGSGTEEDPYLISSAADLWLLAERCNENPYAKANLYVSCFCRLEQDIRIDDAAWSPITKFSGVFDGNGHSISHLRFAAGAAKQYEGLFANLEGCVKDLTITDSAIELHDNNIGGAIAGMVNGGTLLNCHVTSSVSLEGAYQVGGLAGSVTGPGAQVSGCSNAAAIIATGNVGVAGGIAARMRAEVKNCVNTGSISAASGAGGIAAGLGGHVEDCRNEGAVSSDKSAGGICYSFGDQALNYEMNDTTVCLVRCINTGSVQANSRDAGGICAKFSTGTISACQNEGNLYSGRGYCGGIFGVFQASPFAEAAKEAHVANCSNSGAVACSDSIGACGGIGGSVTISATAFTIEDCTNSGAVSSDAGAKLGGILGLASGSPADDADCMLQITGSRNTASVVGGKSVCGGILGRISFSGTKEDERRLPAMFVGCSSTGELQGLTAQTGGILGYISWNVDYQILDCAGTYTSVTGTVKETYPDIGYLFEEN